MKFLLTYQGDPQKPPSPETMAAIGKLTHEMIQSGVVLLTGGLVRPNHGTKLKFAKGKHTVMDGPFPETKEVIDGFALVNAASKA